MVKSILFLAAIAIGSISFIACENDSALEDIHMQKNTVEVKSVSEVQIRTVNKDEIPKGIRPLQLDSQDELDKFVAEFGQVDFNGLRIGKKVKRVKTRSEDDDNRAGTVNITADLGGGYTILIHLAYERKGSGSINVSSEEASTWFFSTWTQTSGVASWYNESTISYSITGDVKVYVVANLEWIEISKQNMSIDGTTSV